MRTWRTVGVLGCLAGLAAATIAQDPVDERERPKRATEIPSAGFWPTEVMIERFVDRITDQMAEHYEFDDEQLTLTREMFKERIPKWMGENRAEIQTLMNQLIESQLYDQPPEIDQVTTWSQRVLPLVQQFGGLVEGMTGDMREYMTEDQQVMLDGEFAAFQTGINIVSNKLSVWADGGYDPETEWLPPGEDRRRRAREDDRRAQEAMDQARAEALGYASSAPSGSQAGGVATPASRPASPKDEWELYTEQFIRRYELNTDQAQKARAFLRASRERRDDYLRGKAPEMDRVSALLKKAENEEQRAAALAEYDKLKKPVERRFQQLKDRLDTLPTRAQRRAAAKAEQEKRASESAAGEAGVGDSGDGREDVKPSGP